MAKQSLRKVLIPKICDSDDFNKLNAGIETQRRGDLRPFGS